MDRVKSKFIAYSPKTKSACIDQGVGEAWWPTSPEVQRFIKNVEKGEVEIEQEEHTGIIVYIRNIGKSQPKAYKKEFEGFKTAMEGDRGNSIVAQVILKEASNILQKQMELLNSKVVINTELELENNVKFLTKGYKTALGELCK